MSYVNTEKIKIGSDIYIIEKKLNNNKLLYRVLKKKIKKVVKKFDN